MSAQTDYAEKIAAMDDADFVKQAETQIWLSAFASNNSRAPAHWKVDVCYDEAGRRKQPHLYQRAYNRAYVSCGYELSESDKAAARDPSEVPA